MGRLRNNGWCRISSSVPPEIFSEFPGISGRADPETTCHTQPKICPSLEEWVQSSAQAAWPSALPAHVRQRQIAPATFPADAHAPVSPSADHAGHQYSFAAAALA